jgi:hypothetical protein
MDALDRIGEALQEQGVSLQDLIDSGRESRQQIVEEKFGTQE